MANTIRVAVNPAVLKWARETSGAALDAAAKRLKVPPSTFSRWEAVEAPLTLTQARALASYFKRPLAAFLLPEPPPEPGPPRDFRSLPGAQGRFDRQTRLAIRKALRLRSVAKELMQAMGRETVPQLGEASVSDPPEEIARRERQRLGIDDDAVAEIKDLPDFLARRVLSEGQEYHGCRVLVYDSVQGRGLAATATQQYKSLYKFNDLAKNSGLCTLLIGHITKRGQVAGPKDLEHNIDAMIYLRRAFRLRPLFVPKNRFGPAVFDPLVLTMDNDGKLSKAPHTTAQSSVVFGWSGVGENMTEAQAVVSLPRYGSNPELNAPNLPRARVKQLMNTISQLKEVDVTNLP